MSIWHPSHKGFCEDQIARMGNAMDSALLLAAVVESPSGPKIKYEFKTGTYCQ